MLMSSQKGMTPDMLDRMPANDGKHSDSVSFKTNNDTDCKHSFNTLHLPNQPGEIDPTVEVLCKKLEQCMHIADCAKRRPTVVVRTSSGMDVLKGGEERGHRSVDM